MADFSLAEIRLRFYRWGWYSDFWQRSHWRWGAGVTSLPPVWWYNFPFLVWVMPLDCILALCRSYGRVAISSSVKFTPFIANKVIHKNHTALRYQSLFFFLKKKKGTFKPEVGSTFQHFPGFSTHWHLHSQLSCTRYLAAGFVAALLSKSIEPDFRRKERNFKPSSFGFLKHWSSSLTFSTLNTHDHFPCVNRRACKTTGFPCSVLKVYFKKEQKKKSK